MIAYAFLLNFFLPIAKLYNLHNAYHDIITLFVQHPILHIPWYHGNISTSKGTNNKPDHWIIRKGFLIMKNYKVYVKGMYTGEIELLASEVVAVERDFEIKLVEVESK